MRNLDDIKREVKTPYNCAQMQRFDDAESAIDWLIDHLHVQGRIVPDGYVAVPLEPTDEMIEAGEDCELDAEYAVNKPGEWISGGMYAEVEDIYKAMIAAAQKVGG